MEHAIRKGAEVVVAEKRSGAALIRLTGLLNLNVAYCGRSTLLTIKGKYAREGAVLLTKGVSLRRARREQDAVANRKSTPVGHSGVGDFSAVPLRDGERGTRQVVDLTRGVGHDFTQPVTCTPEDATKADEVAVTLTGGRRPGRTSWEVGAVRQGLNAGPHGWGERLLAPGHKGLVAIDFLERTHDARQVTFDTLGLGHGNMLAVQDAHDGEDIVVEDRAGLGVRLLHTAQLRINPSLKDGQALGHFARLSSGELRGNQRIPTIEAREAFPVGPGMVVLVKRANGGAVLG